jgi:hypothetical protein
MSVSRLTLAEMLNTTPGSSVFEGLIASSRFYGLTTGGINATEYALTAIGIDAAGNDPERRATALKAAIMNAVKPIASPRLPSTNSSSSDAYEGCGECMRRE